MRILAISDIHNNVACVRKLRAQETNAFDVVVVAGDIGSYRAEKIFEVLATFACPIVYVYGNWDHKLAADTQLGDGTLLHLNVVEVGGLCFTGFSEFSPEHDPHPPVLPEERADYYRRQGERLVRVVRKAGVDPRRTVVVTHERLARLTDRLPSTLLHLFGHIHGFADSERKGSRHLNVSALDRLLPVLPSQLRAEAARLSPAEFSAHAAGELRSVNAGNYVVAEIDGAGGIDVECRFLRHAYDGWFAVKVSQRRASPLVPDEAAFADP